MRYIIDNDLHIHSNISSCSNDEGQTPERILQYAKESGLKTICITDHFWDDTVEGASGWYEPQNFAHISQAKPLPQADGIRFLFGCETELNKDLTLGISRERYDEFDFVIIPTTHLHMRWFTLTEEEGSTCEGRAKVWVKRFDAVLNMDLPFYKTGIAHLTCGLIAPTKEEYIETLKLLPEDEMERLFEKAADLGVGIEINLGALNYTDEEIEVILRPYRIAKKCGCKFYLGSDAHSTEALNKAMEKFEKAITLLDLTEEDKFLIK